MKKNKYIQRISILLILTFAQPMVSSLHVAAREGNREKVKLLLESGTDKDVRGICGDAALHEAIIFGHTEIVALLINARADIEVRDKYGDTPLHQATNGNKEMVKLLIKKGANKDAVDAYGYTPLHRAAAQGNKEVIKVLLEAGANKDALSQEGDTPLHLAAYDCYKAIVEMILRAGADVKLRDVFKRAPLDRALDGYDIRKVDKKMSTETIHLLLLMDDQYGKDGLSLHVQKVLKDRSFETGVFGVNLKKSKELGKESYTKLVSILTDCGIPMALIKFIIIGYYDSFELREALLAQASRHP